MSPAVEARINRELAKVEQSLLEPAGLTNRPWYRHTIYAPGSYAGYAAEILPGITEALDDMDRPAIDREAQALAAALQRASARLEEIARLAAPTR
jgi:N-acetylated-alpha-linked acidic dipeptidase